MIKTNRLNFSEQDRLTLIFKDDDRPEDAYFINRREDDSEELVPIICHARYLGMKAAVEGRLRDIWGEC